jgi:hypothetical protein
VDSSPGVLALKITYSGIRSNQAFVTVQAMDRGHRPMRAIREGRVPITGDSGEVLVRMDLDPTVGARDADDLAQRFVLVQIGGDGGKKDAVKVYEYERDWSGNGGGGGPFGTGNGGGGRPFINLTAQPIGKAAGLADHPPIRPLRTAPVFFKTVPVTANTGTGATIRQAQFTTLPAIKTAPGIRPLRPVGVRYPGFIVGVPPEVQNQQGQGPGASGLSLYDIPSDVNVAPEEILSLHPILFEDANPQSGFFYYLPRAFHLAWDDDTGYALRILYGVTGQDPAANSNSVFISARVTAGINSTDLTLAEKLAQRYFLAKYPGKKFGGLKPFPITGMKPDVNGQAYNIGKDKLEVTSTMDVAGEINLSFTTDVVTKENLVAVLTQGLGLNGTVTMQSASPNGMGGLEAAIPLTIKLGDRSSFTPGPFARNTSFRNPSPYPARLKYLHVLMEEDPARIYSYSLGDGVVAPGGQAQIDMGQVRQWLDTSALKMWVEFGLNTNEDANKKVLGPITIGPSVVGASEVTFRTLTPLADTGAALIQVTISSRYMEPKGQVEKTATLELNKDNESFKLRPIYLINRQPDEDRPNDPLFKYKLTVVKPDGTTKEGKDWIPSSKMTIFIGSVVIKPILDAP